MTTKVTRSGQITIDKSIRDALGIDVGTPLEINREGDRIIIAKKDITALKQFKNLLPKNFDKILRKTRIDDKKRLKRLGII